MHGATTLASRHISLRLFEAASDTSRQLTGKSRDVLCLLDGDLPFPCLFSYSVAVSSFWLSCIKYLAKAARRCRRSRLTICTRIVELICALSIGRRTVLALSFTL
jgi:hypothetical protein